MADTPLTSPQSPATPRWRHYWSLMRADRPIGTLLLLWPTWWALWLAAGGLPGMVRALDERTRAGIDLRNPARVQRAWEVLEATGRGLADWQADTPAPLIAPGDATRLVLNADRDALADRIARRFDAMLAQGALDEVAAMLPHWREGAQWTHAIGAPELAAHLSGGSSLDAAREQAVIATRQYAKSQRIWFRNRMRDWDHVAVRLK